MEPRVRSDNRKEAPIPTYSIHHHRTGTLPVSSSFSMPTISLEQKLKVCR